MGKREGPSCAPAFVVGILFPSPFLGTTVDTPPPHPVPPPGRRKSSFIYLAVAPLGREFQTSLLSWQERGKDLSFLSD